MAQRFTVAEVAEKLKSERMTAYAILQAFESLGLVAKVGVRKAESGKGRGENVYEFGDDFMAKVTKMMTKIVGS